MHTIASSLYTSIFVLSSQYLRTQLFTPGTLVYLPILFTSQTAQTCASSAKHIYKLIKLFNIDISFSCRHVDTRFNSVSMATVEFEATHYNASPAHGHGITDIGFKGGVVVVDSLLVRWYSGTDY